MYRLIPLFVLVSTAALAQEVTRAEPAPSGPVSPSFEVSLKGGVHLKAEDGTPMANVMLTLMQNLGMDLKSFGDSTAPFSLA